MFICTDCGTVFEYPAKIIEVHRELDCSAKEVFSHCPACLSDQFEEAEICAMCGGGFEKYTDEFGMCGDCKRRTEEQFLYFLRNEFNERQREYLADWWDGEC